MILRRRKALEQRLEFVFSLRCECITWTFLPQGKEAEISETSPRPSIPVTPPKSRDYV